MRHVVGDVKRPARIGEVVSTSEWATSMNAAPLAILGSARQNSNTAAVLNTLITGTPCEVVNLLGCSIAPFTYEQHYPEDDQFLAIVERIIAAPLTIFATPVYWYSYSTPMKQFVDRFSDLLSSEKGLGRQLRGKTFALVTSSSETLPDKTTVEAFTRFCEYLGIEYAGCAHAMGAGDFTDAKAVERIKLLLR